MVMMTNYAAMEWLKRSDKTELKERYESALANYIIALQEVELTYLLENYPSIPTMLPHVERTNKIPKPVKPLREVNTVKEEGFGNECPW